MGLKKRQKYFVDSRFQLKFALGFIAAVLIGSILSTALFYYLAVIELEKLQWSVHMSAQTTGEVLIQIFICINFFSLVFVSFFFIITGIRMQKKLNGPVTKLITSLKAIQNGDLSGKIILRRADELSDVAKSIDKMREGIKNQFINSKTQYQKIADKIQDIEIEALKGKLKEKKIKKIIHMVQQLREPNQKL